MGWRARARAGGGGCGHRWFGEACGDFLSEELAPWFLRPAGADNGYVHLKYLCLGKFSLEELGAQGVI